MKRAQPITQQPFRQWCQCELPGVRPKISVEGYSRGADKTFLHVKALHLALDAGLAEGIQTQFVFLTHTHGDHIWDLPFMAKRRAGVNIFCPAESVEAVHNLIQYTVEPNLPPGVPYHRELMPFKLSGVKPGERFFLQEMGSCGAVVDVFECFHTAPCVGYGVSLMKKRLAERLKGKSGAEIAKARAAGEEVDEVVEEPAFVYLGDTSCEIYEKSTALFNFPVIICECSFVPIEQETAQQDSRVEAKKDRHTHWDDLKPVVLAHPNTTFVLIHWSLRYTAAQIYSFFETNGCPPNVVLFVCDRSS